MHKNNLLKKSLVIGIIILFIGASIVPNISGTISKMSNPEVDKKSSNKGIPSNEQIPSSLLTTGDENSSSLTFHTFDKTEEKQCNVVLPLDAANDIYDMLEKLKYKIVYEPKSDETQALKIEFVDLLDTYGLIPMGLSKNYVLSLLNPSWLNNKQKTSTVRTRAPLLRSFVSSITKKIVYLQQVFKNRFGKTILKNFDRNTLILPSYASTATATFCSIASGGTGGTLPLFLLPRPRGVAMWTATVAVTSVGELLTGEGFVAEGAQKGTALGFMGMGLTYAFPGYTMYGFVGYALYTRVSADSIKFYPENREPVISDENPPSGTWDVPLSLSELSFGISDPDGDRMDYTVTTEPDIGSGSGNNKEDGVYTVPISGLEPDKLYKWTVEVTDGIDTTMKQFSFFTEAGPPFDPFDEDWQYRKKITIDHAYVAGDFTDFSVLVSVVDTDLRDKAQEDGDDILFMDGPGVATKLYHEIEYFDGYSGELVAWVNVPSLSSAADTVFYIYYGNPGCSSQQFPEKAWGSSYKAVWHLKESSGTRYDSTFNDKDLSPDGDPTSTSGKIGNANDFDGNDCLDIGSQWNIGSEHSVTFWLKIDTYKTYTTIIGYSGSIYVAEMPSSTKRIDYANGYEEEDMKCNAKTWDSDWHYCAAVRDNGDGTWYINGVDETYFSNLATSWDMTIRYISGHGDVDQRVDGQIDEVRISNIARNQQWISTEYNNQNDPSSFLSVGPEESGP